MKVLIDTNAYSSLFSGDETVAKFLDQSEIVYLSAIVAGELLAGFRGGSKERENRAGLQDFLRKGGKTVFLPVGMETAERFSLIKESLTRKGKPIPMNDIWIAAQCQETGAVLVSYDAHFFEIEGQRIWEWYKKL